MRLFAFRPATPSDADAIATLHTRNWQDNYRGAFSDAFLDDELPRVHTEVWKKQLASPADAQFVECAIDAGRIAGFLCGFGGHDPEWGSFVDNLHVAPELQGRGIGLTLMKRAFAWMATTWPDAPVYLFALEGNAPALRFYERIGGRDAGIITEELHGNVVRSHRYVWPNPRVLDSR